jgi:hypothetical protein
MPNKTFSMDGPDGPNGICSGMGRLSKAPLTTLRRGLCVGGGRLERRERCLGSGKLVLCVDFTRTRRSYRALRRWWRSA